MVLSTLMIDSWVGLEKVSVTGTVEIESWWIGTRRSSGLAETHISKSRYGGTRPKLSGLRST